MKSFEGYLVLRNAHIGKQTPVVVQGVVTNVDVSKKRTFVKYIVKVADTLGRLITLEISDDSNKKGDYFKKELYMGSLGIRYGNE